MVHHIEDLIASLEEQYGEAKHCSSQTDAQGRQSHFMLFETDHAARHEIIITQDADHPPIVTEQLCENHGNQTDACRRIRYQQPDISVEITGTDLPRTHVLPNSISITSPRIGQLRLDFNWHGFHNTLTNVSLHHNHQRARLERFMDVKLLDCQSPQEFAEEIKARMTDFCTRLTDPSSLKCGENMIDFVRENLAYTSLQPGQAHSR